MHELSIAEALFDLVRPHAPASGRLLAVGVFCGAQRGIDPAALQLAWQATTAQTALAETTLHLEFEPWQITCHTCGRRWTDPSPPETCPPPCHSPDLALHGTDELTLRWLETDEPDPPTIPPPTPITTTTQGAACEN